MKPRKEISIADYREEMVEKIIHLSKLTLQKPWSMSVIVDDIVKLVAAWKKYEDGIK